MEHQRLADMIKGQTLHKTTPDETLRNACIIMASANIGALPVVDNSGALIGMLSERDVIKRSVIVYRPSATTTVGQTMTRDPIWLPMDAAPIEAYRAMIKGEFRHLPVCHLGKLAGIVSILDFNPQVETILDRLRRGAGNAVKKRAKAVPG